MPTLHTAKEWQRPWDYPFRMLWLRLQHLQKRKAGVLSDDVAERFMRRGACGSGSIAGADEVVHADGKSLLELHA